MPTLSSISCSDGVSHVEFSKNEDHGVQRITYRNSVQHVELSDSTKSRTSHVFVGNVYGGLPPMEIVDDLKNRQAEIEKLRAEIEKLRAEIKELKDGNKVLADENEALEHKKKALVDANEALRNENKELESKKEEFRDVTGKLGCMIIKALFKNIDLLNKNMNLHRQQCEKGSDDDEWENVD